MPMILMGDAINALRKLCGELLTPSKSRRILFPKLAASIRYLFRKFTKASEFVPVAIAAPAPVPVLSRRDIEVELRRGTMTMKVIWPSEAAADFAMWTRELLR